MPFFQCVSREKKQLEKPEGLRGQKTVSDKMAPTKEIQNGTAAKEIKLEHLMSDPFTPWPKVSSISGLSEKLDQSANV